MAYYRKLKSGKWQAEVRHPNGSKPTHTDVLKRVVKDWAEDLEARWKRGDLYDPRDGKILVGTWFEKWFDENGWELQTRAKMESLWRTHCEPEWAKWPASAITRVDTQQWVKALRNKKRARHKGVAPSADDDIPLIAPTTIRDVVYLMSSLFKSGMHSTPPVVVTNPFAYLDLPTVPPSQVRFYEEDEADALYQAVEAGSGVKWRTLIELGMNVGLRPGELYGLHVDHIDWRRSTAVVTHVMTRRGLREYPKSKRSHRVVPIPGDVLEHLHALCETRRRVKDCLCPKILSNGTIVPSKGACLGLIFSAPEGGPIDDNNFRDRIWYTGVAAARTCTGTKNPCDPCTTESHKIPVHPPQIMRHTAASWLVQAGVPLYDVQDLLGHEDFRTTQRYAHLRPDAHEKVLAAWKKRDKKSSAV